MLGGRLPRPPAAAPGSAGGSGGGGVVFGSPGAKPGGFGRVASRCMPNAASPASYNPPLSPIRGSSDDARGFENTVGAGGGAVGAVGAVAGAGVWPAQSAGNATDTANEMAIALRERLDVFFSVMVSPSACRA